MPNRSRRLKPRAATDRAERAQGPSQTSPKPCRPRTRIIGGGGYEAPPERARPHLSNPPTEDHSRDASARRLPRSRLPTMSLPMLPKEAPTPAKDTTLAHRLTAHRTGSPKRSPPHSSGSGRDPLTDASNHDVLIAATADACLLLLSARGGEKVCAGGVCRDRRLCRRNVVSLCMSYDLDILNICQLHPSAHR